MFSCFSGFSHFAPSSSSPHLLRSLSPCCCCRCADVVLLLLFSWWSVGGGCRGVAAGDCVCACARASHRRPFRTPLVMTSSHARFFMVSFGPCWNMDLRVTHLCNFVEVDLASALSVHAWRGAQKTDCDLQSGLGKGTCVVPVSVSLSLSLSASLSLLSLSLLSLLSLSSFPCLSASSFVFLFFFSISLPSFFINLRQWEEWKSPSGRTAEGLSLSPCGGDSVGSGPALTPMVWCWVWRYWILLNVRRHLRSVSATCCVEH